METMKTLAWIFTLQPEKVPNWMVVVMGVGVVFVGLIAIIVLCKIMGLFFIKTAKKEDKVAPAAAPATTNTVIENRQEIIAPETPDCAEEMGKDISALRVISFKKL